LFIPFFYFTDTCVFLEACLIQGIDVLSFLAETEFIF